MIVLDTSAWIELFRETEKGKTIETLIKNQTLYTSIISVAELAFWADKNNVDKEYIFEELKNISNYIELDFEILKTAGGSYTGIRAEKKGISMIDVIIYTSAIIHGLKLITCDRDFDGLAEVKIV